MNHNNQIQMQLEEHSSSSKEKSLGKEIKDEVIKNTIELAVEDGLAHITIPEPMLIGLMTIFKKLEKELSKQEGFER